MLLCWGGIQNFVLTHTLFTNSLAQFSLNYINSNIIIIIIVEKKKPEPLLNKIYVRIKNKINLNKYFGIPPILFY